MKTANLKDDRDSNVLYLCSLKDKSATKGEKPLVQMFSSMCFILYTGVNICVHPKIHNSEVKKTLKF